MKNQTIIEKRAEKDAKKDIENFLRLLDAENPQDSDDIYSDNYYSEIFERTQIAKMINEYDSRREQARKELNIRLRKSIEEARNGFKYKSLEQKYSRVGEGKQELEGVLKKAGLRKEDAKNLLVPALCKLYRIFGFNNFHDYRLRRKLYLSH